MPRKSAEGLCRWLSAAIAPAEASDTDRNAIEHLIEWITTNERHFDHGNTRAEEPVGLWERESGLGDKRVWYILKDAFCDAMLRAGYDPEKTMRRLREEGVARCSPRRLYLQKRVRGNPMYVACISQSALERLIDDGSMEDR